MKIFTFTDLHGNKKKISDLLKKIKKSQPDILVCAGDITNFGSGLQKILNQFKKTKLPLFIIPGNHETNIELTKACKKTSFAINIHKKSYEVNNYVFFGYGLGGFEEFNKDFESIIPKFKKTLKQKKVILVTHQPPYNTNLDRLNSRLAGNKSIRKFIKATKPILAISGHIHENENKKDKIGPTLIINPGPKGKIIKL